MSRSPYRYIAVLAALALASAAPAGVAFAAGQQPVCPGPVAQGFGRCHAWVLRPLATTAPTGLNPSQIIGAYGFSSSSAAGSGQTIAIVDAYNDPNAESDL